MRIQDSVDVALSQVVSSLPHPIVGLALVTDTDIQTLHAMALSRSYLLQHSNDPDLLWMPVDWDLELDPPGFDQASIDLEKAFGPEAPGGYKKRATRACNALMEGLQRLQQTAPELREYYMTVIATDSGELWGTLEGQVVLSLNGAEVAERWQRWRQSWLGE
ncbi:MAG: hypothetical protein VX899_12760 [Myxococcota bacterium]|nr:hypothetical protein [Myxococcota bacterium]